MKDLLSQEEINALLQGVTEGEIETEPEPSLDPSVPRPYDFVSQNRIVRGRMPTLEMINERFARHFRINLFNFLQRVADIQVTGVRLMKLSEYLRSLSIPAYINVVRCMPLWGRALFVLDASLVFTIIDNFFGGGVHFNPGREGREGREFSPTEMRIIMQLLELVFGDLEKAWKPIFELKFEYLNSETNPLFATVSSPTEIAVVSVFSIHVGSGSGTFHIAMPYSMIEPIRELLAAGIQSDRGENDDRWNKVMEREILHTEVLVTSTLLEKTITIETLLQLQTGDVIPIKLPEKVTLVAEGVPVGLGRVGISNGHYAIEIEERIEKLDAELERVEA